MLKGTVCELWLQCCGLALRQFLYSSPCALFTVDLLMYLHLGSLSGRCTTSFWG